MSYEVRYSSDAIDELKKLRAFDRTTILDQVEQILSVNPTIESKARFKRLREPAPSQYRLRVGEFRVFYDVDEDAVLILKVLSKQQASDYLGESL